jgi:tape measure domain-containing protein
MKGLGRTAEMTERRMKSFTRALPGTMAAGRAGAAMRRIRGGINRTALSAHKTKTSFERMGSGLKEAGDSSIVRGLNRVTSSLFSVGRMAAFAGGAFAALVGGSVVRGVASMAGHVERMKMALSAITGSKAAGNEEYGGSLALADKFALDPVDTQKQYVKLRAMQFSKSRAEEFIKLGADLRGAGIADDVEYKRFLRAATQVMAKGRLQAEELNQQFSEAGVSVALVLENLKKPLGLKTNAQVMSAITAGNVNADMGLTAVSAAINQKLNQSQAGDTGLQFADSQLGKQARLKAAPAWLQMRVLATGKSGIEKYREALSRLIDVIKNIDTGKIAKFTDLVFGGMLAAVPKLDAFMTGFGEGFDRVMESMRGVDGDIDWRRLGNLAAEALGLVASGFKLAGKAIQFFQTPAGEVTLWAGGAVLALGKVVSVVGGIVGGMLEMNRLFKGAPEAAKSLSGAFGTIMSKALPLLFVVSKLAGFIGVLYAVQSLREFVGSEESRGEPGSVTRDFSWLWNKKSWNELFPSSNVTDEAAAASNAKPSGALSSMMKNMTYAPSVQINVDGNPDPEQIAKLVDRVNRDAFDNMQLQGA